MKSIYEPLETEGNVIHLNCEPKLAHEGLSELDFALMPIEELRERVDSEFGEGTSGAARAASLAVTVPANSNRALDWLQSMPPATWVASAAVFSLAVSLSLYGTPEQGLNDKFDFVMRGPTVMETPAGFARPIEDRGQMVNVDLPVGTGSRDIDRLAGYPPPLVAVIEDRPFRRAPSGNPGPSGIGLESVENLMAGADAAVRDALVFRAEVARLTTEAAAPGWAGISEAYIVPPDFELMISPSARNFYAAAALARLDRSTAAAILAELRQLPDFDEYRLQLGDRVRVTKSGPGPEDMVVSYSRNSVSIATENMTVVCIHAQPRVPNTCAEDAVVHRANYRPVGM